jgi:hypothetical protein
MMPILRVELEYYADSDHTFSPPTVQDRLISRVVGWFEETLALLIEKEWIGTLVFQLISGA